MVALQAGGLAAGAVLPVFFTPIELVKVRGPHASLRHTTVRLGYCAILSAGCISKSRRLI